jgi:hypothetical protein
MGENEVRSTCERPGDHCGMSVDEKNKSKS